MPSHSKSASPTRRGGVPRGLLDTGPILLSYGFRPFFLGGAVWAATAMLMWIVAVVAGIEVADGYGARAWHAHEMLFGFASAVLAGFLLTAVPNWTGRLPVSGPPLLHLFLLWCVGRIALLLAGTIGVLPAVALDSLFLPALLAICVREVVAGRKWADLKVMAGLGALSLANICFHYEVITEGTPVHSARLATAAYVMMIIVVGGRMLPSFTRNWLNKSGRTDFPVPYNRFDLAVILASIPAFGLWVVEPESAWTGAVALAAATLHAIRLYRWRGWTTVREPLVTVLHLAYAFVPLGFLSIAAAAQGLIDTVAALHVLTVGTIASMMLAVMTRATRGHTGRELTASRATCAMYAAIFASALVRPLATIVPDHLALIYASAGMLWIAAFLGYLLEYGPMLIGRRRIANAK
jgi:uncharacterized protein involved in response to NO